MLLTWATTDMQSIQWILKIRISAFMWLKKAKTVFVK